MSFLEELEKKFAEKGQEFPEKDLLMKLRNQLNGTTSTMIGMNHYSCTYSQSEVHVSMPPFLQMPMRMPMYNQPYQPQWNGGYMMESRPPMPPHVPQISHPYPATNTPQNIIQSSTKGGKLIF